MSEELTHDVPDPKFPSFTMDMSHDLADITNISASATSTAFATDDDDHFGNTRSIGVDSAKPWDKPIDFSQMTKASVTFDEDGGGIDVPDRMTIGPGAAAARLDLQRCTMRVHKQLVDQIKTNSMKPATIDSQPSKRSADELSRCQGELWLKSRMPMVGWKKRYGSIVDHAYFGPVLFLFKYDAKGNVALHHSMMIVLVDSHVRLGKNSTTKDRDYRCEFVLKTTKRRYLIAANHTMRRDYWLRNLENIQQHASTNT